MINYKEINTDKLKWVEEPEHFIYRNKEFIMTYVNGIYVGLKNEQETIQAWNYIGKIVDHIKEVENDIQQAAVLDIPFYQNHRRLSKTYQVILIKNKNKKWTK